MSLDRIEKPCLVLLVATLFGIDLFFPIATAAAETPTALVAVDDRQPQYRRLQLTEPPKNGEVRLKGPLPSIIKVWRTTNGTREYLEFGFNVDATEVIVYLPQTDSPVSDKAASPLTLEFLVTENSSHFDDGVVVLSALDSKVIGTQAKLETHPGSHRIGYWVRKEDYVQWSVKAPALEIPEGTYEVELVYSRANETGTEVEFLFNKNSLHATLAKTGSWYRYRVMPLGKVSFEDKSEHQVEVHVTKIVNGGVMNLKAIVLAPVK